MAKNIFTAVDPQGRTHKRSTARAYAYTVVTKQGVASIERQAPDLVAVAKDAARSYDVLVAQSKGIHQKADLWRGEAALKFFQDFAIKHLADGSTRESGVADAVANARKWYDLRVADGRHLHYENAGWCSRLDLAQKLAATFIGYEDVQILPATQK